MSHADTIATAIRTIVAHHADMAACDLPDDATFESLGIDSFNQMEIILDVEDTLSLSIDDASIPTTLAGLIDLCKTLRGVA